MVVNQLVPCPHCSAANEADWAFCQHCGKKLGDAPPPPATVDKEHRPAERGVTEPPLAPQSAGQNDQFYAGHGVPGAAVPFDPNQETVVLPALPQEAPPPEKLSAEKPREVTPAQEPALKAPDPELQGPKCLACGQVNREGSSFCASCGAPQKVAEPIETPPPPAPAPLPAVGRLRLIVEGSDDNTVYDLQDETLIGRRHGDITFAHDGYMSDNHARIVRRGDHYVLSDEGSRNGVYIKIKPEVKLEPGDYILIGRQLFQFKV